MPLLMLRPLMRLSGCVGSWRTCSATAWRQKGNRMSDETERLREERDSSRDKIERLREERDYLRYELNNETDRYMAMKETNSVHIAEIERLRALITEWVDAYGGGVDDENRSAVDRYCDAVDALREEAGR